MEPGRHSLRPRSLPLLACLLLLGLSAMPAAGQVGEVRGEVRSGYNDERYGGVMVSLLGGAIGGITAADGSFFFPNVPVGDYTIRATLPGFALVDSTLVVTPGGMIEIILELTLPWVAELPPIQPGTYIDSIRDLYSQPGLIGLPPDDHEDRSLLPIWYRKWVRSSIPGLANDGPQQYPIEEMELLRWTLDNQDMESHWAPHFSVSRPMPGGQNINLTNRDALEEETSVAEDPNQPNFVVAASNSTTTDSWALTAFRSSDGGCSWNSIPLPHQTEAVLSYDPSLAWDPDGNAWVSSIVRFGSTDFPRSEVQLYRSATRGASWEYVATVSQGNGNDKEMIAIDPRPRGTTGFGGRIYVAWTQAGVSTGIRFRWSNDYGLTWSSPITKLSSVEGASPHIAVGPDGEVYVAWREATKGIKVKTSTNGGDFFEPEVLVADAMGMDVRFYIPASCGEQVLSYPVLAVDPNSSSPNFGHVHITWTDLHATGITTNLCTDVTGHTDVYFSTSDDHGRSWSPPVPVHDATAVADEFNQWMDVDPSGTIHLTYYGTEPTPDSPVTRARVRLQYVSLPVLGSSWTSPMAVATDASDATNVTPPMHYGHYSGLAALGDRLLPVWTDGRPDLPGERHQVFSAAVQGGSLLSQSCELSQVVFNPSSTVRLKKGTEVEVEVQVFRDSAPLADEWISIDTISGSAITLLTPTVQADASGKAKVRVRGERRGTATLGAEAAGVRGSLNFRVRGVWAWWMWAIVILAGLLIAALVIWLVWKNSKPWLTQKWLFAIALGLLFVALFTFAVWYFFE